MLRQVAIVSLLPSSALVPAAHSFSVNGKIVSLSSTTQGGQVYVGLKALAQALGLPLTYDAASGRYTLGSPAPAAASGSGQLASGDGLLGHSYTLANNDDSPLNFTLRSAGFVATRVNIGTPSHVPAADQKLLVLHFSVQNAGKGEARYSDSSVKFTVVDDRGANHQNVEAVGREGSSDGVDLRLKPAQKLDVFTVLALPAAAEAPKLVVQGGSDTKVLRYDLHGVIGAVAAPYADPQHPQQARAAVPASLGETMQVGLLDVRLNGVVFSGAAIGGTPPDSGHRYLVASLTVRNGTLSQQRLSYNNLTPTLRLASGDTVAWNQALLKAGSDDALDVQLTPGEETRARLYFEVPTGDAPRTLGTVQDTSRRVDFDVSGAK